MHYLFPEVRCLTENGIAGRLDAPQYITGLWYLIDWYTVHWA